MIMVQITLQVQPEKHLELQQTLLSLIEPTMKEPGCLRYAVLGDIRNTNSFSLLGEWKSREDLDHHLRSPRFGALLGAKILLCEPQRIWIHTVSHSEGMEAVQAARNKR